MHGVDAETYRSLLVEALSCRPDLIIDDGGDLLDLLSGDYAHLGENIIGGAEETTTGIHRDLHFGKSCLQNHGVGNHADIGAKTTQFNFLNLLTLFA